MPAPRLVTVSGLAGKAPACFVLEAEGRRIMLDLGRGPDHGRRPDLAGVGTVDALVLSHAHGDHVGSLDQAARIGDPPLWATDVTADLAGIVPTGRLPARGRVTIAGLEITTGRGGHAPGGVWVHVAVGDGLLYCGDICPESALFAYDPPPPAATVVIDYSYGLDDTDQETRWRELRPLLSDDALLPVPADGRGVELAWRLWRDTGRPPRLGRRIREVLARLADPWRDWLRPGRAEDLAALLTAAPAGPLLVSPPHGASGEAAEVLPDWPGPVVLTGHVAAGSPAETARKTGRAVWRRWNVHARWSDNAAVLAATGARQVVPAFSDRDLDALPDRVAPGRLVTEARLAL